MGFDRVENYVNPVGTKVASLPFKGSLLRTYDPHHFNFHFHALPSDDFRSVHAF